MLALKLLLVPALVGFVSWAGKRWGPGVAGRLAGFPSVTGPILFFLAFEQGAAFTTQAAIVSLSAVPAAVAFGITYSWCCTRMHWSGAWALATLAWTVSVVALERLPVSFILALALAFATLFAAPKLFPKPEGKWGALPLPTYELILRMAAGAAMVLFSTAIAEAVGPGWTGLIAVFPVMSSVVAVFSQRANGPGFVVALLRAMVGGFYAFIAFCAAVALLLEAAGVAITFLVAFAAAVAVQGAARAVAMKTG